MEDVFHWIRKGDVMQVRMWLDDTEHDMNVGDDHQFSPLHWACKGGHLKIGEMLLGRGATANATNMGDDTPLHLATSHGHLDVVHLLLRHLKNDENVNSVNEHGNTALHYACFNNYESIAIALIEHGAIVNLENKYGESPLDKCSSISMAKNLLNLAIEQGQDVKSKRGFKDQSWMGLKTRSRDATLSRHKGININELYLTTSLAKTPTGETWKGRWQGNDIAAKILNINEYNERASRAFNEEYPKLRIFSHPNVAPVVAGCNSKPHLVIVSQLMPLGSLYDVLHNNENNNVVIDSATALKFALDIAKGMAFLHNLEKALPTFHLNSKHIMIDCQADNELVARINMADARLSFQERGKLYHPAWMAPEALLKSRKMINARAADMWSFAIVLWELAAREPPFPNLSPMEVGMKIATEGMRIDPSPGVSAHMSKLIRICMNEDPAKRPSFEQVIPILEKMNK